MSDKISNLEQTTKIDPATQNTVEFEWFCENWRKCQHDLFEALSNCFKISTEETFDSDWLNPDITDDELKVKFSQLMNKIDSLNSAHKVISQDELSAMDSESIRKGIFVGE